MKEKMNNIEIALWLSKQKPIWQCDGYFIYYENEKYYPRYQNKYHVDGYKTKEEADAWLDGRSKTSRVNYWNEE